MIFFLQIEPFWVKQVFPEEKFSAIFWILKISEPSQKLKKRRLQKMKICL